MNLPGEPQMLGGEGEFLKTLSDKVGMFFLEEFMHVLVILYLQDGVGF